MKIAIWRHGPATAALILLGLTTLSTRISHASADDLSLDNQPKSTPIGETLVARKKLVINVGVLPAAEKTARTVTIDSPFSEPFVVRRATRTCGCVTLELPERISPDGKAKLKFSLLPAESGKFEQTITLTGDIGTKTSFLQVSLVGIARKSLEVELAHDLWEVPIDRSAEPGPALQIPIKAYWETGWNTPQVVADPDHFDIQLDDAKDTDRQTQGSWIATLRPKSNLLQYKPKVLAITVRQRNATGAERFAAARLLLRYVGYVEISPRALNLSASMKSYFFSLKISKTLTTMKPSDLDVVLVAEDQIITPLTHRVSSLTKEFWRVRVDAEQLNAAIRSVDSTPHILFRFPNHQKEVVCRLAGVK